MSEDQNLPDSDGVATRDSPAADTEDAGARKRSLAMPVALLALCVALAAVAGLAWLWLEQQPEIDLDDLASAEYVESLEQARRDQGERLDALRSDFDDIREGLDSHDAELADLRQSTRTQAEDGEEILRRLDDLEGDLSEAVARLEETAGDQRAVDRELARRLLLMEAAALLRSGQQRAELADDYSGARAAYRRAYRLLREFDDPRASRARGQVAQELEALEAMSEPDWTSMSARIDRLVAGVDDWPAVAAPDGVVTEQTEDDDADGWWARMGATLAGLVRVQPRDAMPVTAEELDLVREQIRLRLIAADLSIARRNLEEASRQLRLAAELVERWFDTERSAVKRDLEVLAELAATEPAGLPDLGGSLAEIQRLLEDS